ncbi:IgGFc-binding protein-like [Theristicus caerulescens]
MTSPLVAAPMGAPSPAQKPAGSPAAAETLCAMMDTARKLLVGVALVLLGASTASPAVDHRFLAILDPASGRARPRFHRPAPTSTLHLQSTHDLDARRVLPSRLNATAAAEPPPPPRWGRRFVVAPLGMKRSCGDVAYVLAARGTRLRYATGAAAAWVTLRAGDVLPIALRPLQAVAVFASSAVAVYYFHAGAEPFVAAVAPLGEFCSSYRLRAPPGATAVLVAAGGGAEVTVNGRPLRGGGWRRVPGGEFWWREVALGDAGGSHRLQRPNGTFGVLSYGVGRDEAASRSWAVCECDDPDPCRGILCRPGERCRVSSCHPRCEAVADATCQLQAAARTFDGAAFALPNPCRYVVARTCDPDASLPAFSVEAAVLDAGVASLLVRVYDVTVASGWGEEGFVRTET